MTAESKFSGLGIEVPDDINPYAHKILEVEGSAMAYGRHSKCLSSSYFRFRKPDYVGRHWVSQVDGESSQVAQPVVVG